jgi:hypothetical protein
MRKKNFETEFAFLLFGGFFVAALFLIETDKFQIASALHRLVAG